MKIVDADTVTAALSDILDKADWSSATERAIKAQLKQELGAGVAEHFPLIKRLIDGRVAASDAAAAAAAVADGGKRTAEGDSQPERPAKAARTAGATAPQAAPAAGDTDVVIELDGPKRTATVRVFKGKILIDVREYYEKDGKMLPGKKGISLTVEQFEALAGLAADVSNAVDTSDHAFSAQLGSKRKVSVDEFKGRQLLSIREYYEKDGKELPGSKGISLQPGQWTKLQQGMTVLQAAIDAHQAAIS